MGTILGNSLTSSQYNCSGINGVSISHPFTTKPLLLNHLQH